MGTDMSYKKFVDGGAVGKGWTKGGGKKGR
jgi:hypothetical protein